MPMTSTGSTITMASYSRNRYNPSSAKKTPILPRAGEIYSPEFAARRRGARFRETEIVSLQRSCSFARNDRGELAGYAVRAQGCLGQETDGQARKRYAAFVAEGAGHGRRPELTGGGLIRSSGGWSKVKCTGCRASGENLMSGF